MGTESLTYAVWHHTVLRYTDPVGLSFNEVRMRPRDRGSQRTLAFSLLSNPAAVPRSRIDYFGNYVHRVDVTTPARRARVRRRRGGREQRATPATAARVVGGDARRRPPPRVRAAQPARAARATRPATLWREWNGDDRSFDAVLATAERIPKELRYVTGATTVEFEHRRPPRRRRGRVPGLQPPLPGDGPRRGLAGALRQRLPRPRRRPDCSSRASHTPGPRCAARTDAGWDSTPPTVASPAPTTCAWPPGATTATWPRIAGCSTAPRRVRRPEVLVRITRISPQQVETVQRGAAVHWQQQQQQQQR